MIFEEVLEIKNGKNQRAVENPEGKYPICRVYIEEV